MFDVLLYAWFFCSLFVLLRVWSVRLVPSQFHARSWSQYRGVPQAVPIQRGTPNKKIEYTVAHYTMWPLLIGGVSAIAIGVVSGRIELRRAADGVGGVRCTETIGS